MTTGELIQKLKNSKGEFFFSSISKNYKSLFFGITFGTSRQTKHTQMQK
jgi:hypothetical protein